MCEWYSERIWDMEVEKKEGDEGRKCRVVSTDGEREMKRRGSYLSAWRWRWSGSNIYCIYRDGEDIIRDRVRVK